MVYEINNDLGLELLEKYFSNEIVDSPFNIYSHTIAYVSDNIIKGIIVYDYIVDRLEIDYIVVDEKYRNNGIASNLLSYLIEKYNCGISLEVKSNNEAAIKLYEKHGFYKAAIRKKYYGNIDAILMIRE